ncbi:MAG: SusC/RagA family TonB-linked outer membrane protein [Flavisolibacter sp.]
MKRIVTLIPMLMLFCALAFGQTRTVTGTVRDNTGKPVPFATITETGKKNAVTADADGNFSIKVSENAKLTITAAGHENLSADAAGTEFTLTRKDDNLSEVVVTALGIRRNKNTVPYSAQQISGDDVSQSRSNNFVSSMSGKISGLEVRQGNGLGGATNVVIRGTKSLLNNNQALFVIDGVPVDNSNTTNDATATGRVNDVNNRPAGSFDYGSAAADINPDDIETITVLKGAAASALYGSRAANGVIMITTKKGRKGLGITVNTGFTRGAIDKETFPTYQKEYGAGYATSGYGSPDGGFFYFDVNGDGVNDRVTPTTEDASYGVRFDPNLMIYQWDAFDPTSANYKKARPWVAAQHDPSEFYKTALSTNTSIMLDGGNETTNFKLGYTRNQEEGVLPNSRLIKNLINFGSSYKITDKLTAAASINFSKIEGKGRYGNGYNKYNVNQSLRQWWEMNVDIKELEDAYMRTHQNITWNWASPSTGNLSAIYFDNPYWVRYQNYETDERNRYFGNVSLNYRVLPWLNILGRVSLDSYDEQHEERIAKTSVAIPAYTHFVRTYRETNYDLLLNFDKNLSNNFNLKALLGTNLRRNDIQSMVATTNGGLVVPGLYSISNSASPINAPDETAEKVAVDGYFTGFTLDYQHFLTLDATARVDRASTLPEENNTYWYPSISGSFLFSKFLTNWNWLSSGKLRLNYAEVGNNAPFASLTDVYDKPTAFGGTTLFSLPIRKNNPELKPERTKSKEIGLEMAFFKNRLGFDFTYYDTKSIDQIFPVAVSTATGYSSKFVNAGTIQNKGIELSIFATPVKSGNFTWTANINWSRNRNEVLSLYEDSKNLQINPLSLQGGVSINATLHQPYGTIQGKTWQMLNGEKLVGANGRYAVTTTTNNVIGNINPDWIGGFYNTLKYKNLSLGFLIDVRQGGDVFSLDMYYGLATGIYPESAGANDKGNPSRSTIANGGGVIMPGVKADGKPNDIRVENIYGTYGYVYNPQAAFVYDASYVKLREAVLTYALPQSIVNNMKVFKGIELSLIGRNLWIIHKNLPYSDPEENITSGNIQGYQTGAFPTTRAIGMNLKLKF